ncbi:hypothetical protein BCR37DRAFT_378358 [Protomyces lactucae-debilis]|uniref:RRM domain-containing protein n=1 Tax=Protomyces lactucae-debilis TaxID=2754530 RepID=A0A1Y2FK81_PROLT|nr:uncharacterized protein BCR37DRAFT_378358 [Protomyces lactucae-debilis]ORY84339.1 hypothetical protein BCR37DRAFT_378358 [Protomyces lactucae-debilis]
MADYNDDDDLFKDLYGDEDEQKKEDSARPAAAVGGAAAAAAAASDATTAAAASDIAAQLQQQAAAAAGGYASNNTQDLAAQLSAAAAKASDPRASDPRMQQQLAAAMPQAAPVAFPGQQQQSAAQPGAMPGMPTPEQMQQLQQFQQFQAMQAAQQGLPAPPPLQPQQIMQMFNSGMAQQQQQQQPPQQQTTPQPAPTPEERPNVTLKDDGKMFIGGLNWETTDESLRKYFEQFGAVAECNVMRDGTTGRSRGFGFLTFADPNCVDSVVEKEHFLDGKIIDPKRAIPRDEQEKTAKMFVGGVPADCDEEEFKDFFKQFGRVIDATLMMDKDTGRPRGFGFITFDAESAVERCVNAHNLNIHGKGIEVKRATPKGGGRDRQGPGAQTGHYSAQNVFGGTGANAGAAPQQAAAYGGMSSAMMAQYYQRMQAWMQQMQAMGRGGGMAGGMMNPMMMQQMQQGQMQQPQQPSGAQGAWQQSYGGQQYGQHDDAQEDGHKPPTGPREPLPPPNAPSGPSGGARRGPRGSGGGGGGRSMSGGGSDGGRSGRGRGGYRGSTRFDPYSR